MKKHLKKVSLLAPLLLFVVPFMTYGQEEMEGTSTSTFVNSAALWIAVIIGFVASFLVFRNAKKIGGGVLAKVYNYFGVGMFLVVLGFFAVVIPPWGPEVMIMRTHDALFIIGYVVMAMGARKILSVAQMVEEDTKEDPIVAQEIY